jgi:hypothetical protein
MKTITLSTPLLFMTPLLWSCASVGSVGPARPTADLSRPDYIVWHSLKRILSTSEIQEAGVGAACVGMGEAGGGIPAPQLIHDFADADPMVVSNAECQRTTEGGEFSGAPAIFLSFFNVNEEPGRPSVAVRVEVPGADPTIRRCTLREALTVRLVRREGDHWTDPLPSSGRTPPPPSVIC